VRRGLAKCFVALHLESDALAGYYTLSASAVALKDLPKDRNLGRHTNVPAVLPGRLAVDNRFRHQGLGQALLFDAMRQMLESSIGAALFIVDAKNKSAADFYRRWGVQSYGSAECFFLSLQDIKKAFEE
jgi:predicted GNAT family N-acyltransferase